MIYEKFGVVIICTPLDFLSYHLFVAIYIILYVICSIFLTQYFTVTEITG